ncbi:toprim domain-containing protein [Roseovarius sp.]|uniref:DUF7146 domain-containing protein n=1 Tax=Roseovarius sp. TaxID=1486281 RepID=UPI003A982252
MYHTKTTQAAKGKWRGILLALGIPEACLKNRHGPCPMCGGRDRFRWDNKDGAGTYYCNRCGAGDGMKLAMQFTGKPFREAAKLIDQLVGNAKVDMPRPAMTADDLQALLRSTYRATTSAQPGDLVHTYLATRGVDELIYPEALRFAPKMSDGAGGVRPSMVAIVSGQDGKAVTMHRTFLKPDGSGKAEMEAPRKLMPGKLPDGACVRLCEYVPGGPLGIAEGIETALSASALYEIPVWAALNSSVLKRWRPPAGSHEIAVFGDNDPDFGGQAAAFALAQRLRIQRYDVTVHLPEQEGEDWNDVLLRRDTTKTL